VPPPSFSFDKEFFMDLIFRAAVDEHGNEVPGAVDSAFWERVSAKRAVRSSCCLRGLGLKSCASMTLIRLYAFNFLIACSEGWLAVRCSKFGFACCAADCGLRQKP
jgi:hypothetical protein